LIRLWQVTKQLMNTVSLRPYDLNGYCIAFVIQCNPQAEWDNTS
jgi:hypothetical protein